MRSLFSRYSVQAALISVAIIWGATFVVVADAVAKYPMFAFLGWRFAIAAVAFVVVFPKVLRRIDGSTMRIGVIAGLLLTGAYVLQTWGVYGETATTPARSALITGLYVVLVPIMQAFVLKRRVRGSTLVGIALAVAGLIILSGIVGNGGAGWVLGDTLTVLNAVAFAIHIVLLGTIGPEHDVLALTFIQLAVVAVVTTVISLAIEGAGLPTDGSVWLAILICALFASTYALVVQNWAQRRIQPARVALILVTEPAFGGLFGWLVAGAVHGNEVVGAVLMLAGLVVSEMIAARRPSDEELYADEGLSITLEHHPVGGFDDGSVKG